MQTTKLATDTITYGGYVVTATLYGRSDRASGVST